MAATRVSFGVPGGTLHGQRFGRGLAAYDDVAHVEGQHGPDTNH